MADAPIAGRLDAGIVWTGRRAIIWGGVHRAARITMMSDGAAYDPARDRWVRIASAPDGVLGGGGDAAAWTGRLAVFWAGNAPDGPARGAAYRPATDSWRILPTGPLGPREGYASFWTGSELAIVGGISGDGLATPVGAALDPVDRTWRRLPGLRPLHGLTGPAIAWTGEVAYLGGTIVRWTGSGWATRPVFAAYDLAADSVTEIAVETSDGGFLPLGWTGSEVIGTTTDPTRIITYEPSSGTWEEGATAPCASSGEPQSAWLDDRYLIACGRRSIAVYDVASGIWRRIEAGPSPFNALAGSQVSWTGRGLFVWSGVADRPRNPTPDVGAWIALT